MRGCALMASLSCSSLLEQFPGQCLDNDAEVIEPLNGEIRLRTVFASRYLDSKSSSHLFWWHKLSQASLAGDISCTSPTVISCRRCQSVHSWTSRRLPIAPSYVGRYLITSPILSMRDGCHLVYVVLPVSFVLTSKPQDFQFFAFMRPRNFFDRIIFVTPPAS